VVDAAESCSKTTFAKELDDLVPITNVIADNDLVVTLVIVVAVVLIIYSFLFFGRTVIFVVRVAGALLIL
jgi:hypothetical protein